MENISSHRRVYKYWRKGGARANCATVMTLFSPRNSIHVKANYIGAKADEFTRFVTSAKSSYQNRRTAVITRAERKIWSRSFVPRITPVEQADIKASIAQPSRQAGSQAGRQAASS